MFFAKGRKLLVASQLMSAEGTAVSERSEGKSFMIFTIVRSAGQRSAHLGKSESRSRAMNFQSLRIFRAILTEMRCGSPDIKLVQQISSQNAPMSRENTGKKCDKRLHHCFHIPGQSTQTQFRVRSVPLQDSAHHVR